MLKVNIDGKKVYCEMVGDLNTICSDLSNILGAINDRLTQMDPEIGLAFKESFTKGFMDGICFGTDREHMEHYLSEADEARKREERKREGLSLGEVLSDFVDFLKAHENPLGGAEPEQTSEGENNEAK